METKRLTNAQLEKVHSYLTAGFQWSPQYDPDAVQDVRGVLHSFAGKDSELDDWIARATDEVVMAVFCEIACARERS